MSQIQNTYCVYGHKNKITNKWYIGQTINGNNPEKRWRNGKGYVKNFKFFNAIKKYSWDNFEHIIFQNNLTKKQADDFEKFYIKKYNSIENGYNMTEDGEGGKPSEEVKRKISKNHPDISGEKHPMFGKHHSEETRKKMSESNKGKNYGKRHSNETKEKISKTKIGSNHSEETKRKMSEAKIGKYVGKNSTNSKKILCLETSEIFDTIKICAEHFNINYDSFRKIMSRNSKNPDKKCVINGYHFIYYDKNFNIYN